MDCCITSTYLVLFDPRESNADLYTLVQEEIIIICLLRTAFGAFHVAGFTSSAGRVRTQEPVVAIKTCQTNRENSLVCPIANQAYNRVYSTWFHIDPDLPFCSLRYHNHCPGLVDQLLILCCTAVVNSFHRENRQSAKRNAAQISYTAVKPNPEEIV